MRKPEEWIATFSGSLRVSRVDVDAAPMLDLVEVTVVDPEGAPAQVYFFDRVEAQRLHSALGAAVGRLEAAEEELRLYEVGFIQSSEGRRWTVFHKQDEGFFYRVVGAELYHLKEEAAAKRDELEKAAKDHKRPPLSAA